MAITHDNFIGFSLGGFRLGFSRQTDHLTRMLPLERSFLHSFLSDKTEVWATVTNNEYNLYRTTPELFIVINKFATMFSNGVFQVKNYKTGEVIENHPLLKLLEKPSPLMNRNIWLMDVAINYNVYGSAFIFKNKGSSLSDFPSFLVNLPNSDLSIKKTGKMFRAVSMEDIIDYYKLRDTNDKFEVDEVIRICRPDSNDPIKGTSPIHALQMPVSNIRGAMGFRNTNITKKGALGIISSDSQDAIGAIALEEEDKKDLERQFSEKTHGVFDGQSSVKISPKPIKYQHTAYPIKDSMLFEEVSENMMKIIDAYGLNVNIFSRKEGSKYTNLLEGLRMAYQDAIIPFAEMFCFSLNDSMGLFEKGIYVELDYSHIPAMKDNEKEAAETVKTRAEALQILIANGLSQDEAEKITGIKQAL